MRAAKLPIPTEEQEQRTVAAYLDRIGVLWCHVPNGSGMYGGRNDGSRIHKNVKLKAMGVKSGVPDILIFDGFVAIELKRRKDGKVSPKQREWIEALKYRGWRVAVCNGAGEAIEQLKQWGYK